MAEKLAHVEYACSQCGKKTIKRSDAGRPDPGTCPKKNGRAHTWVKNRSLR